MVATTFEPFSSTLEDTPHGAVHCAMVTGSCPNGLMGSISVAALDPIFYAHHTNIDRLYECCLRVNQSARLPKEPTQLNTRFTFRRCRRQHETAPGGRYAYHWAARVHVCRGRRLSGSASSGNACADRYAARTSRGEPEF